MRCDRFWSTKQSFLRSCVCPCLSCRGTMQLATAVSIDVDVSCVYWSRYGSGFELLQCCHGNTQGTYTCAYCIKLCSKHLILSLYSSFISPSFFLIFPPLLPPPPPPNTGCLLEPKGRCVNFCLGGWPLSLLPQFPWLRTGSWLHKCHQMCWPGTLHHHSNQWRADCVS